jgi:hypothetical protein
MIAYKHGNPYLFAGLVIGEGHGENVYPRINTIADLETLPGMEEKAKDQEFIEALMSYEMFREKKDYSESIEEEKDIFDQQIEELERAKKEMSNNELDEVF